jgi:hypothetical protein
MIKYASGFRWCLSEQDKSGRQTRGETLITHCLTKENSISFYSSPGICERRMSIRELSDLGRHGHDGIMLSSEDLDVILRNAGDQESGGLLIDLLNNLVEAVNVDIETDPSETPNHSTQVEAKTSVVKFLESYLRTRK